MTSKPLFCSATATAAPPIPPPATTILPHLDTSTSALASSAAIPAVRSRRCFSCLATDLWPALPNAHSALSRSSSLNASMRAFAERASAANKASSIWSAFANAHAMLAISPVPSSSTRRSALDASILNNLASTALAVVNAQATVAICGASSSSKFLPATARAIAVNNAASNWPIFAKAYAVFTKSCVLCSSKHVSARRARPSKSSSSK
mmetsp:Transcript_4626/g.15406  ORF Transcript_4626/g.15406 Transcript_4626/m.15406 type:complete len:208 (+) Transcript_4626:2728-3351(+)